MEVSNSESSAVRVFATIGSINDIHNALRERFEALEFSRATIDAAAGLAHGHAAKLFAMPPIKRFGDLTLFPTLEAAGLRLALIEDPAAMERAKTHPKRDRSQIRNRVSKRMMEHMKPLVAAELGRSGGLRRVANQTASQRSESARKAALSRWRLYRAAVKARANAATECGVAP
jgi:hypothetical protein